MVGGGGVGTGDRDDVGFLGGLPGALGEGEIFAFIVGCQVPREVEG